MFKADLNDISAFLAVARSNSFTEAARAMGVPKSYISRHVANLEERLNLRLIERTTRSVSLTNDGLRYFESCERAFQEIEETEKSFEQGHAQPKGRVRVTCPVEFGPHVTRHLCQHFLNHFPEVNLEVLATNNVMNLVDDQIDAAIRPMSLADPSMRHFLLGEIAWGVFASRKWLHANKHNLNKPEDLKHTDIIAFNPTFLRQLKWNFQAGVGNKKVNFTYTPKMIAGNLSVLIEAVLAGVGVASLPDFLVHNIEKAGQVVRLFPNWDCRKEPIGVVYLNQKYMPARTRALLDTLKTLRFP